MENEIKWTGLSGFLSEKRLEIQKKARRFL